jgi:hypothetical protein
MSQNIFQIDPIFFLPIDFEENSKVASEAEEEDQCQNDKLLKDHIERHKKNMHKNKKYSEDDTTIENSSSGKDLDKTLDISKIKKEKPKRKEEKEVIVFSTSANDPHIKSMTNSSKIYISEIFKQNWKLKSRRLITKLKKKLIKQYQNSCIKENIDKKTKNNNINDHVNLSLKNNSLLVNKKINLNNVNDYIFDCTNNLMNNINSKKICIGNSNKFINFKNICANININFNQYNNNYQIINNSIINNGNDQYKNILNRNNIGY